MNEQDQPSDFDPRTAMSLADETEAKTAQAIFPHTPVLYFAWGTAWLIGYGALHGARYGWLPLGSTAALIVLFGMLAAALVITTVLVVQSTAGIRGASSIQGAIYGWTWGLAFVVVGLLSGTVADSIAAEDLRGLIINAIAILVVGMMYMLGGALWRDIPMTVMGIWFLVVNVVAMALGREYYLTVFMTLGVLGFYTGAIVELVRSRSRRTLA
ncbi:hypothetical protein [Arthrobacter pigmenti]